MTFVLLLSACSVEDVDLDEYKSTVTVSGWVSDEHAIHQLTLSYSAPFGTRSSGFPIEDAMVQLKSTTGLSYSYRHIQNGLYESEDSLSATITNDYFIEITLPDGGIIRSQPESPGQGISVDSLTYDFYERESITSPGFIEKVYFPIAYASDPAETNDFYRWKVFKNDSLFGGSSSLIVLSDRFFNGNEYQNEFVNFEYALEDKITVELIEISPSAYEFLSQLKAQTSAFGFNSSISPSPVNGNLFFVNRDDEVLGYFGIVALDRKSTIITQ